MTLYYVAFDADSLHTWEVRSSGDTITAIAHYSVAGKDLKIDPAPYLDDFPGTEYAQPVKRIYMHCKTKNCIACQQTYEYGQQAYKNDYYQLDGSDRKDMESFLEKLLAWLNTLNNK